MGDKDKGDAGFQLQPLQFNLHFLAQLQVQRRKRFVQKQNLGRWGQSAGQGHPLLLAAGQLAGFAIGQRL